MYSPKEIAKNYIAVGKGKATLPFARALVLGILAGAFIALAGVGATTAAVSISAASVAKFVGACIFPAGLSMVIVAGSELFTGNCLLVIPLLEREISFGQMLKSWLIVYIGNLIGSLIVAALCTFGHVFSLFGGALAESAVSAACAKVGMGFGDAFIRGILCNFLVCIAVWMAMGAKSIPGKIIGLFFPVMLFVLCGFEHSVANMYYISAGLFIKLDGSYAVDTFTGLSWGAFFVKNLIPVTLGNIVGGSVCVGLPYWFCYLREADKAKLKTPARV